LADIVTPSTEFVATNPRIIPEPVACAIDTLRETVDREHLTRSARLQVVTRVRQAIVPKRKPGRKNPNLDSAWPDYQRGVRGLKLYRRHIPDHGRMNQYHRAAEENRLLDGLRKRARRLQERVRRRTTKPSDATPTLQLEPEPGR
jgi:hypothetical protein